MGLDVFVPVFVPEISNNVPIWYILLFYVVLFAVFCLFRWLFFRK